MLYFYETCTIEKLMLHNCDSVQTWVVRTITRGVFSRNKNYIDQDGASCLLSSPLFFPTLLQAVLQDVLASRMVVVHVSIRRSRPSLEMISSLQTD